MAIVIASDLSKANADNASNIETIIGVSANINSAIASFISESSDVLVGGGYDAVRAKLGLYTEVFDKLGTICKNLQNNIKSANSGMFEYMDGYSVLDDSELDEINVKLSSIRNYISYLYSLKLANPENNYNALISHWSSIYNELDHFRDLLDGLKGADSGFFGTLSSSISDVRNIGKAIGSISTTTFSEFSFSDEDNIDNEKIIEEPPVVDENPDETIETSVEEKTNVEDIIGEEIETPIESGIDGNTKVDEIVEVTADVNINERSQYIGNLVSEGYSDVVIKFLESHPDMVLPTTYNQDDWNNIVSVFCKDTTFIKDGKEVGYKSWATHKNDSFGGSGCGTCTLCVIENTINDGLVLTPLDVIACNNECFDLQKSKRTGAEQVFYDIPSKLNLPTTLINDYGLKRTGWSKDKIDACLQNGGAVGMTIRGGEHYVCVTDYNEDDQTYILHDSKRREGEYFNYTYEDLCICADEYIYPFYPN